MDGKFRRRHSADILQLLKSHLKTIPNLGARFYRHQTLKMKTYFKLLSVALLFAACEKDDQVVNNGTPGLNASSHAQFAVGNYWVYEGFNIDLNTGVVTPNNNTDSLYIGNDTTINGELYYQFKGDRFPNTSFSRNLRVDGSRIIDENGSIYMDLEADQDTVETIPTSPPIDSANVVVHSLPQFLETPSGNYTSDAWQEIVYYLPSPFPSPNSSFEYYVDGVGVAVYSSVYVSSQVRVEMRLKNYFVQ